MKMKENETQAQVDFSAARKKALINKLQHFLNLDETTLLSFSEVKKLLKPRNEIYRGIQVVDVRNIVGSEERYEDFDNHFFPKNMKSKNRWQNVDIAVLNDITLPPISLYEVGGLYFVRDGNHRVSVFKSQGVQFVDAEVTSLSIEFKLRANAISSKNLLKQLLRYEKRNFYAETNFGDITNCWDLDFSSPGRYDIVMGFISAREKYLKDQNVNQEGGTATEVTFTDAVFSWYTMIYEPVIQIIQSEKILKKFKGCTASDMFMYFVRSFPTEPLFASHIQQCLAHPCCEA